MIARPNIAIDIPYRPLVHYGAWSSQDGDRGGAASRCIKCLHQNGMSFGSCAHLVPPSFWRAAV